MDVRSQITTILRLDALDQTAWGLEQEALAEPQGISAEELRLADFFTEQEALQGKRNHSRRTLSDNERMLEDVETRQKRASGRMALLVTSTQIEATQREIASLEQQRSDLEDYILEGMDALEGLDAELEVVAQRLDEGLQALADRKQRWTSRRSALEAQQQALRSERDPLFATLNSEARRTYEVGWDASLRGQRMPPAGITQVDGDICVTCRKRVPPLWINEVKSFRALHSCDGCKRLLAIPEPVDEV